MAIPYCNNFSFLIYTSHSQGRSDTVDLTDTSLLVDISDALSEREKVKFTVHTKVSNSNIKLLSL